MKAFLFVFFCIFFSVPLAVYAHGLSLFSKEKTLYASYSDHTPASGAKVVLVDANGVIILQDKMDEKGIWKLPENLETIPHLIIVDDSGGHRAMITWEEFLKERPKGLLDILSIRVVIGVMFIIGGGYAIQRFLLKKKT